jgi:hypothetical protein
MVTIVVIVMKSMLTSSSVASNGSISSGLEERSRTVVDQCRLEFLQAQFTGLITVGGTVIPLGFTDDNTAMVFRMPGNIDANGNPLANGTVVTGYISPLAGQTGFRENLACVIRFEAENVLRESTAAPSGSVNQPIVPSWGSAFPPLVPLTAAREIVLNSDVNRDGDRTDLYVRGKLRRYYVAPDGHPILGFPLASSVLGVETMSDNMVLAVAADGRFNGQMDQDPRPDGFIRCVDENGADVLPINLVTLGRAIEVTSWHGAFDDLRSTFMVRKGMAEAKWRNRQ